MESHNPQKTQNIIKDITTTELSSYQIQLQWYTEGKQSEMCFSHLLNSIRPVSAGNRLRLTLNLLRYLCYLTY